MLISNALVAVGVHSITFARSKYHHLPSPFPVKLLKAIATAQIGNIKTVPCIFTVAHNYKLECTCIFCHIT